MAKGGEGLLWLEIEILYRRSGDSRSGMVFSGTG